MRTDLVLEQITAADPLKTVARTIDVFDTTRSSLDQLKEILLASLSQSSVIAELWAELNMREQFVLLSFIDYAGSLPIPQQEIFNVFECFSKTIHDESNNPNSFEGKDPKIIAVYKKVVEVALKDNRISSDEREILDALRLGLEITHHQEMLIYAQLGLFEDITKNVMTKEILKIIGKRGLIFEIGTGKKKTYDPSYVVPFEIAQAIKETVGIRISDRNYRKFLLKIPNDLLKKIYESSSLPNTRGQERMIENIIRNEYPIKDILKTLDVREVKAISYFAGFKPTSKKKNELIEFLSVFADIDDLEDLPVGVYLDETLAEAKVEQLVRCWRNVDTESLNKVLDEYLIANSKYAPTVTKSIIDSKVPLLDLMNHHCVNADCISAIVSCLGERVMNKKSDNLKKISVYLNDTDRNLIRHISLIAKRDVIALNKEGYAFKNDEIPNMFERLTKYIFDNSFNLDVVRHPTLIGADGQRYQPDGAINLEEKRVILWDNKASLDEYTVTTKGQRPHFEQFKSYIEIFRSMYPQKQLISFLVVTSQISASVPNTLRRLKEKTNCDVCVITSENLSILFELYKSASDELKQDLNLFNMTGEITEERIRERLLVKKK